jgi:uncharacterized membrane protein
MTTVEVSVVIAQPAEVVTQAFLNAENAVHWETDLERFEVIERKPGEVGSIAHLHYKQGDKRYILEDVMEAYIPNQYFRSRVTGGGLSAQVETWMRETSDGTEVTMRWQGKGTTLMMRLLLPFLRGAIQRQSQQELETFKALVEKYGARFGED